MKIIYAMLGTLFLSGAAAAQSSPPQSPTPVEQALGNRVYREVTENIQKDAQIILLQEQLKAAQKTIEEIKEKSKSGSEPAK